MILRKLLFGLLGLVALPLLVLSVMAYLNRAGFFNIAHVEVNLPIESKSQLFLEPLRLQIEKALQSQKGQALWRVNLKQLAEQVASNPTVKSIRFMRQWPRDLLAVVEFKEIPCVLYSKGKWIPVAEDGSLLEPVSSTLVPDVPILRGQLFEKQNPLRQQALAFLAALPDNATFSRKIISEINFDQREGFWLLLNRKGIRVKIGTDSFEKKISRVSQVLDYIQMHGHEARLIDANLSKKVLVRLSTSVN